MFAYACYGAEVVVKPARDEKIFKRQSERPIAPVPACRQTMSRRERLRGGVMRVQW